MRELAEEFGISVASVHSILLKSGGRSRKAAARYLFSRKLELDICRDYLDSRSAVDVGKKYEVSHVIVLEIARAYGIITSKRFRQACRRWRL